ncbi:MAG: hypothetical protein ACREUC_13075, partial [Steroidobacteraceae bacterium]
HPGNTCIRFTHDIDARNVAAGAPLIDVRDNVVIGIHTRLLPSTRALSGCTRKANAMIVMSDWLERTLRAEIESQALPQSTFDD